MLFAPAPQLGWLNPQRVGELVSPNSVTLKSEPPSESMRPTPHPVCAKLTVELSDRIDATVAVLGISKRLFIERALIEAMDQADAALAAVGALDDLEGQQ